MNKVKKWLPAIIVMAFIFTLSSIPGKTINDAGFGNESLHVSGHFMMFFVLFFALYKATHSYKKSLLIILIYAVLDEFHQSFTPARSVSLKDVITDSLAGLAAGGLLWSFYQKLPKTLKNWLE